MVKQNLNHIVGENQITLALFALYLLLSSNYLGELFTCSLRRQLTHNMLSKHIIAIITLYVSVILTTNISGIPNKISATIIVYIWFLITTKCTARYVFAILLIIGVTVIIGKYIDSLEKEKPEKKEHYQQIKRNIRISTFIISIIISIIGFVIYYRKKKIEYGKRFDLKTFIFGVQTCSHE